MRPPLWRHRGYGAFQYLKQGLLDPLAGYIPGYTGIVSLARDLVDLVNIDYALFRLFNVIIGCLDELEQYILNVFTDVTRFS